MTVIRLKDFPTGTALAKTVGVTSSDVAGGRENADLVTDLLATATVPAAIGAVATFLPAGTSAVATTIQNKLREAVSVKDFGAVGDGVVNDTLAIRACMTASAGKVVFLPPGTYNVTWFVIPSGTTLLGVGAASHIVGIEAETVPVEMISVTDAILDGVKVSKLTQGAHILGRASVRAYLSTRCIVRNCFFENSPHSAVFVHDASYCTIDNNYFVNAYAPTVTEQTGADIIILRSSHYNKVTNNRCFGGTHVGISIWDDNTGAEPVGNQIVGNYVSGTIDYGIIVYVTTDYDTKTLVEGNYVWDIAGAYYNTGLSGKPFGAAIYIQNAGGSIIRGNFCWDFCQQTTLWGTLAPGGIGVTTIDIGTPPVIVTENHIHAIRGPCINITGCPNPVIVSNNELRQDGSATVNGAWTIQIVNAVGVTIENNKIDHNNTDCDCIRISAADITLDGIIIDKNRMSVGGVGIELFRTVAGKFTGAKITNNTISDGNASCLLASYSENMHVHNNHFTSTGLVFYIAACPNMRWGMNHLKSTGAGLQARFAGTANTGSIMDHTNMIECQIENDAGSGVWIETLGGAAPAYTGIHDLGARVINRVPTIGQPKAWRCTTAGNPGTWTSEGNL